VEYPRSVHLIRGNHEAADINALFGFRLECLERLGDEDGIWWVLLVWGWGLEGFGQGHTPGAQTAGQPCQKLRSRVQRRVQRLPAARSTRPVPDHPPPSTPHPTPPRVWKRINALFNWLPLAALIEGKILCMHGGIGRCINTVDQIGALQRPITMEEGGPVLMDLLWSDPTTNDGVQGVQPSPRGPGLVTFGPDRVKDFCKARRGGGGGGGVKGFSRDGRRLEWRFACMQRRPAPCARPLGPRARRSPSSPASRTPPPAPRPRRRTGCR
jgi:hypothetical protein